MTDQPTPPPEHELGEPVDGVLTATGAFYAGDAIGLVQAGDPVPMPAGAERDELVACGLLQMAPPSPAPRTVAEADAAGGAEPVPDESTPAEVAPVAPVEASADETSTSKPAARHRGRTTPKED